MLESKPSILSSGVLVFLFRSGLQADLKSKIIRKTLFIQFGLY